jgi:hypothetical protein
MTDGRAGLGFRDTAGQNLGARDEYRFGARTIVIEFADELLNLNFLTAR